MRRPTNVAFESVEKTVLQFNWLFQRETFLKPSSIADPGKFSKLPLYIQ